MMTLNIHGVDVELAKRMAALVSKGYAYCTRRCCKRGSPDCFSCMFRDIRTLHRDITRSGYGTDDDRQGSVGKADAVQLVRKEVDGTR